MRSFGTRERLDLSLGFVTAPEIPSHSQCWIRGDLVVLDRLRQDGAQASVKATAWLSTLVDRQAGCSRRKYLQRLQSTLALSH